jgi:hypothetical protein
MISADRGRRRRFGNQTTGHRGTSLRPARIVWQNFTLWSREGPRVRRLAPGGEWIRNFSSAISDVRGTESFADSPLEEGGFELAVPPRTERPWETQPGYYRDVEPETRTSRLAMPSRAFRSSGTEGSNPLSSSGESANRRSLARSGSLQSTLPAQASSWGSLSALRLVHSAGVARIALLIGRV